MEDIRPIENKNFIDNFIEEDLAAGGRFEGKKVHTRFPPEPNGYLHIGHCKALTIDFGTAEKFGGLCNLRMDDTNPTKEDTEGLTDSGANLPCAAVNSFVAAEYQIISQPRNQSRQRMAGCQSVRTAELPVAQ